MPANPQTPASLPPEQVRALKRRAHALKPVVTLGAAGLTDSVLAEINQSLAHHELMKLRLPAVDKSERASLARAICEPLAAHPIQQVGFILTLYRKNPDRKPKKKAKARNKKPTTAADKRPKRKTAIPPSPQPLRTGDARLKRI